MVHSWKTTESVYSIAYNTVDWYRLDNTVYISGHYVALSIWDDSIIKIDRESGHVIHSYTYDYKSDF